MFLPSPNLSSYLRRWGGAGTPELEDPPWTLSGDEGQP